MPMLLAILCSLTVLSADRTINSFETPEDLAVVKTHNVQLRPTARHATDGRQALQIRFQPADWPNAQLVPSEAWNWADAEAVVMDVANPEPMPITFSVRIDDQVNADKMHWLSAHATLQAGESATFAVALKSKPMELGMRGLPRLPGVRQMTTGEAPSINLAHVVAMQVFLDHPAAPRTLVIDNIRFGAWHADLKGIVDRFGQYSGADWPGKLHEQREFAERREKERQDLAAHPALDGRDEYGGWKDGPTREATGFFRTERIDGKWWLVTPTGHLFFSAGMDCVNTYAATITTGREYMFSWLPQAGDPLARHIGRVDGVHSGPIKKGASFNFLAANLERKYGPDAEKVWFDLSLDRLKSWGFNTIANWSDRRLYGNGRVPYTATIYIGGNHPRISSGSDYWGRMHDPFDPRFATSVSRAVKDTATRIASDPWCVGYFVDNELSWGGWGDDDGRYGLARGALAEPATCAAKRAIVERLREKYSEIEKLNRAWEINLADWAALDAPFKVTTARTAAAKADMGEFVHRLAHNYFETVRDELRRHDRNHLYLGCRFAWHTQEAVRASAEVCDVVSCNIYDKTVGAKWIAALGDLGKPLIVGEFHFGALDRGMFHVGLVEAADQNQRASMYADYVRSALDHPAFVGCHWFQYLDEPLTGRTHDGENYNIGFVDTTDTPYPELVASARKIHAEMYARRWGRRPPADR